MRRRDIAPALFLLTVATGLAQSNSIAGRVADERSVGMAGVVALAIPQTGGEPRRVVSGANGSYAFQDLPDGVYRIDFDVPGFDVTRRNGVAVRAGETTRLEVTMYVAPICECLARLGQSKPPLIPMMGQVMDAFGRPLPHAQLEIIGPLGTERVYSSREGRFQVRLSADDTWPLTARDSGFGAVTIQVSGSTRAPLLFRLPSVDAPALPAEERLRGRCCPGELFANLGP